MSDALVDHYDGDLLLEAVKMYVSQKTGPFLVFDFAVDSRTYIEIVKKERASVNKFKEIVEETKKRLAEE